MRKPRHPLYASWRNMRQRCNNPKNPSYKDYGGRTPPIKVCPAWDSFEQFVRDVGPRPKGRTLGRINNDGDYCKKNCRWETPRQQAQNTRATLIATLYGVSAAHSEWGRMLGLAPGTISNFYTGNAGRKRRGAVQAVQAAWTPVAWMRWLDKDRVARLARLVDFIRVHPKMNVLEASLRMICADIKAEKI